MSTTEQVKSCKELPKTTDVLVIHPNGNVERHPYGTGISGRSSLMKGRVELAFEDKKYAWYVDEEGLLKGLEPNFIVGFPNRGGWFAKGPVIRQPKERRCSRGCHQYGYAPEDRHCDNCGASHSKLQCCARCHEVSYCNQECQRAAWDQHKKVCKKCESN